jgi:hypothetical protein
MAQAIGLHGRAPARPGHAARQRELLATGGPWQHAADSEEHGDNSSQLDAETQSLEPSARRVIMR